MLPVELQQLCLQCHYSTLLQQVTADIKKRVVLASPDYNSGLLQNQEGIWTRQSGFRNKVRWGLAIDNYQDFVCGNLFIYDPDTEIKCHHYENYEYTPHFPLISPTFNKFVPYRPLYYAHRGHFLEPGTAAFTWTGDVLPSRNI